MLSVDDAVALVTAAFAPLAAEQVNLTQALGRVLAEDVAARLDQPPADVSAMDGYAVRAADTTYPPVSLTVIGESAAGVPYAGVLGGGEAVRISTGAALPAGADAIVIQEDTVRDGDFVTVRERGRPDRWIRRAGLDFARGTVLLKAGRVLTARDVGLAAAMNVPWLKVRRKPRIALAATGDELAMPGDPLGSGGIVNANSLALAGYVTAFGGDPLDLGIARDTEESLRAVLDGAAGADLLVTMGGASVGDHDLVRKVIGDEGLRPGFYKVAMRPGKPLIFGRVGTVPVLGLPGNPVSVGVTALLFLKPAMEVMLCQPRARTAPVARLGCDLPANGERQAYLRATLSCDESGERTASPFPQQDSAMLRMFADAGCLIVRDPHAPAVQAGASVPIILFPSGRGGV